MSEEGETLPAPETEKKAKAPKAKKRPSDFEIVRTILQRAHERKLPYLLKNMGEGDLYLLSSETEDGFVYGSSEMSFALIQVDDPELKVAFDSVLAKCHGLDQVYEHQVIVNIKDQISELAKTKGESIPSEVLTNGLGTSWTIRKDVNGKERELYFSKAIESLYHTEEVTRWCSAFSHLLTTDNPDYLYFPYVHPMGESHTHLHLIPEGKEDHPIGRYFPDGFRVSVTRGVDVILDKFLTPLPYPVESEEIIFFNTQGPSCKMVHRLVAQGWRMILLRPNSVFVPKLSTPIPTTGTYDL